MIKNQLLTPFFPKRQLPVCTFFTYNLDTTIVFICASIGNVDLSDLLSSMDDQIAKAKEQALSRKDILDKVEKWKHSLEEENWLDEYERVMFYRNYMCLCKVMVYWLKHYQYPYLFVTIGHSYK